MTAMGQSRPFDAPPVNVWVTRDLFSDSNHVRLVELASASDRVVWEYAKANGFTLVSLDSDFAEMAALLGSPPKVIWLRCGNQPTSAIERLLRGHSGAIAAFQLEATAACLEIY
jgi:predicted nuclease of predicted toxin-antitoxin system